MTNANAEYEAWARHERCLAMEVRLPTPDPMCGPGRPVRTYQQSQFVNYLHSAIGALESSNADERARVANELRAFLEKQGIST